MATLSSKQDICCVETAPMKETRSGGDWKYVTNHLIGISEVTERSCSNTNTPIKKDNKEQEKTGKIEMKRKNKK